MKKTNLSKLDFYTKNQLRIILIENILFYDYLLSKFREKIVEIRTHA